ncbi:DUF1428 domain-containing protein [Croceicoccus naphthovorans]|uniref:RNA signal recognition particle 4.5S RNA n=1 Tax=Croceicoccus naphthovorans TaxID=1348774 RepID=A0A0G3XF25_9SPHN|nr:DUF1428 domain-containing protein [Croceicoccus naphthovorans]AKM09241.1 RNA signal recognition particle 4.5S RNA [Croceicoccus naphthovorans]MBB3990371.1 uncharacterized protein YbaA (DUF1428 family) [Croceicoccus naphthovorans]
MYIQGFLIPVPADKKEAYRDMAAEAADYFKSLGATEIVEAWEDNVADGKTTDFRMAVKATADEKIVFSWIVWPDRATCDAASEKMEAEMEMPEEMPFDGKRMIFGGFEPIFTMGR